MMPQTQQAKERLVTMEPQTERSLFQSKSKSRISEDDERISPSLVTKIVAYIILLALSSGGFLVNMHTLHELRVGSNDVAKPTRNVSFPSDIVIEAEAAAAATDEKTVMDEEQAPSVDKLQIIDRNQTPSDDQQQMIVQDVTTHYSTAASLYLNIAEYTFPSAQERLQYYMGEWYNKSDWTTSESTCNRLNKVKDSLTFSDRDVMYTTTGMKECMYKHDKKNIAKYCADAYNMINGTLLEADSSSNHWLVRFGDGFIGIDNTLPIISKARASALSYHSQSIIWLLNKGRHYNDLEKYHNNIVRKGKEIPWSEKLQKIFWRGSTTYNKETGATRIDNLAQWINYNDNRTDIAFSNVVQMKTGFDRNYVKKQYFRRKKSISDMNRYKYLLSVEGNDVATGLKWMLYSNSVVFMSRPTVATWAMEDLLVPFVHYIPLANDYSNLLQMMQWAEEHDEACQEISKRATEYMERLWISDQAKKDTEYLRKTLVTSYVKQFDGALSKCDPGGKREIDSGSNVDRNNTLNSTEDVPYASSNSTSAHNER